MKLPQNMSSRYVRSLLIDGKNDLFILEKVEARISSVDNVPVGTYYITTVSCPTDDHRSTSGIGATPEAALRRTLGACGVTFR